MTVRPPPFPLPAQPDDIIYLTVFNVKLSKENAQAPAHTEAYSDITSHERRPVFMVGVALTRYPRSGVPVLDPIVFTNASD
jgi:hypothetical protein